MNYLMTLVMFLFSTQVAAVTANLSKSGLALEGFDPVSYFSPEAAKKGPLKGDSKYKVQHEQATYLFSSEAHKEVFLKNPDMYIPAFGGWCAYAVAEKKEKVEVDVKSFLIQDGRLLLFYNGFLADTRDKWLNTKAKPASSYLKEADAHWPQVKNKEP